MEAEWRELIDYPGYWVNNMGEIKNRIGEIKPYITWNGYARVWLNDFKKSVAIHRLVMAAFVGPIPKGYETNHIDGCKTNNTLVNLEYCTSSENKLHAHKIGLKKPSNLDHRGFDAPMGKQVVQATLDGWIVNIYGSVRDAARKLGHKNQCIAGVCRWERHTAYGYRWQYTTNQVNKRT